MMNKKILFGILAIVVLAAGGSIFLLTRQESVPEPTDVNTERSESNEAIPEEPKDPTDEQAPTPMYDLTTPSSLTFIANKQRPLPADYVPSDLITPDVALRLSPGAEQMQFRSIAHADLQALFTAAQADGVNLVFGSGYRSYALQKQFYDSYVARDGQEAADRYSARPGTSEHQTGLSFDVTSPSQTCHLEICFEDTPQGQWMAENAHTYGFILRYPPGKEAITGYQYEPWHFRYFGPELAQEIHESGKTAEEFFEL